MNLKDIFETSQDVLNFDTEEECLINNKEFLMSWGIARQKATETMYLINALLTLKKQCKISDFDFQLVMEGFDVENLFGNE